MIRVMFTLLLHMFTSHAPAHVSTTCVPNEHHAILMSKVQGCHTGTCLDCHMTITIA